jgi:hypothetical protein
MGVLYSVEPLTVEAKNILTEAEISYPEGFLGRLATPREIRVATTGLEGFIVEFNAGDDFDQVDIHSPNEADGPWTLLNISSRKSTDEPAEFYFEKGWPEAIFPVLINLSKITGPWIVITDSGEPPLVVTAEQSLEALLTEWDGAAESGTAFM